MIFMGPSHDLKNLQQVGKPGKNYGYINSLNVHLVHLNIPQVIGWDVANET